MDDALKINGAPDPSDLSDLCSPNQLQLAAAFSTEAAFLLLGKNNIKHCNSLHFGPDYKVHTAKPITIIQWWHDTGGHHMPPTRNTKTEIYW